MSPIKEICIICRFNENGPNFYNLDLKPTLGPEIRSHNSHSIDAIQLNFVPLMR